MSTDHDRKKLIEYVVRPALDELGAHGDHARLEYVASYVLEMLPPEALGRVSIDVDCLYAESMPVPALVPVPETTGNHVADYVPELPPQAVPVGRFHREPHRAVHYLPFGDSKWAVILGPCDPEVHYRAILDLDRKGRVQWELWGRWLDDEPGYWRWP